MVNASHRYMHHRSLLTAWALARRGDAKHDVSVFFIPQRSLLCERLLKAEGVWGDLAIADIPVHWIPYDTDVLSLELDGVFRVRHRSCRLRYSVRPSSLRALVLACMSDP